MRKIRSDEVKKVSKLLAQIFNGYAAYELFFPEEKKRLKGIEIFFRYEISASRNYTYVSDDFLSVAAVKRPGDRDRNPVWLFLNPVFAFSFFGVTGAKSAKLAKEYVALSADIASRHYNPATDCYIKNIGVAAEARGQGRLRLMIDELCGDSPIYLETHSEENVAIYEHMGFKVCEKVEFHGYHHYAMWRDTGD